MSELLRKGDRLVSVWSVPVSLDGFQSGGKVGYDKVLSISVDQLPGSGGYYAVAVIVYEDHRPDLIVPLHNCIHIEVQQG